MDKLILAAYSGLTVVSLIVFAVSTIILERCIRKKKYDSTFLISLSMSLLWLGQFVNRLWWATWKTNYMSREPSAWMYDHAFVLISCLLMICGGLVLIRAVTYEVKNKAVFFFSLISTVYVMILVYIVR